MREIFGLMALLQLMQMNSWVESKMEDVFSSTAELANLHSVEKELLQYIKEYKKELEESIKKIKSSDDLSLPIIHPKFEELVEGLPGLSEVEGGGNGIFLLQEVYQLNSSLLSEGKVRLNEEEYSAKHSLSYADIEFVAKLAYNRGFYDRAVEWFILAASKPMQKKEKLRVTKLLATTIKKHDLVLDRKGSEGSSRSETWRTNPLPFDPILRKKKKFKKIAAKQASDQESKDWENFNRLCRGEYKEDKSNKALKSYYLHYQNPYLMLGPWKLDVQSNFPFIAVFRGFLYDEEMNHYTDYAMNKLFRSEYGGSVSQGGTIKGVQRTSKQAWLHEHDFPETTDNNTHWSIGPYHTTDQMIVLNTVGRKISERISLATGLYSAFPSGGESYQIANYGLGGVYNPHPDPNGFHSHGFRVPDNKLADSVINGDRMATFMGYLSSVQLGGNTVFPKIDVSISPEKGSAAFWWNLSSNGVTDTDTVHGGCPVLVGSKWITNKWIRWTSQALNYPCPINTNERIKPLQQMVGMKNRFSTLMKNEVFLNTPVYYTALTHFSPEFKKIS